MLAAFPVNWLKNAPVFLSIIASYFNMGLVDWLKQLWSHWFAAASPASSSISLAPQEVPQWLEHQLQRPLQTYVESCQKRFAEIRFLLKHLSQQLSAFSLAASEKSTNTRIAKIVSSAHATMVPRLLSLLVKLEPPRSTDLSSIQQYNQTAFLLLEKEVSSIGKNIAYTSFGHRDETKNIGQQLGELEEHLRELYESSTKQSAWKNYQNTLQLHKNFSQLLEEKENATLAFQSHQNQLQNLTEKLSREQTQLDELSHSAEAQTSLQLNQQLASLQQKLSVLRQHQVEKWMQIEKPFKRFLQLVDSGHWSVPTEQKSLLNVLSTTPSKAFELDPKAATLKSIAFEMQKALQANVLSFKDPEEREKHRIALQNFQSIDFFSDFFWKQTELSREIHSLEKILRDQSFSMLLTAQKRKVSDLTSEQEALQKEHQKLAEQRLITQSRLQSTALTLQEQLQQLSGKNVSLTFV